MSHVYYSTRLFWMAGCGGIAKLHGRVVDLKAPPQLLKLVVEGIDYTPEVCVARILPQFHGWRDMESEEIRAADALLRQLVET